MNDLCHNCGSPWFEDYGVRCGACGAYAPGSMGPMETGEEQEVSDGPPVLPEPSTEPAIPSLGESQGRAHYPLSEPAIPSLGESQFFDASPSSTEIP